MKRYTLLLEIREIVVIFAIINKIKTMKLTVKDGLFSFEAENVEEGKILENFIESIGNRELILESYSYYNQVTEINLRWQDEFEDISEITENIRSAPIPKDVQNGIKRIYSNMENFVHI